MARGSLYSGCNRAQREALEATEGPVLILAGAGTGKTRTVTYRMGCLLENGVRPENILAVTFTNKAANEMRERTASLVGKKAGKEMTLCTFHSLCVRILRRDIGRLGYKTNFSIMVGGDQQGMLKQLIVQHGATKEKMTPGDVLAEVSKAKNAGMALGEIPDDLLRTIAMSYQRELRARNALDFDDLLLLAEQVLREHRDARDWWRAKFRYVTVDEFQDTNGLQMELLQLLVGPPYNVCVVGDDDQSIYGWRGAQVSNILNFDRFFPDPRVVRLEENYRSTEAILRVANKLIAHNPSRHDKALRPTIPGGEKVLLMGMPGDDEEAAWVAEEIQRSRDGGFVFGTGTPPAKPERQWEDFAILFRTNTQIRRMEQAMREAEIPYRLVGAQSFFDRKEVRDVLAYIQLGLSPDADVALLRVLNTPPRGIASGTATLLLDYSREMGMSVWAAMWEERFLGELSTRAAAAVRKFAGELAKLQENFAADPRQAPRVLRKFLEEAGYIDWLMRNCKTEKEEEARREAVGELMTALTDALGKGETLQHFIDTAALDKEPEDDLEKKQGVTLITLHASKGLEFPVVFLVGIEEGILPHQRSMEEGTKDEERRLFYVGITRAQQKLYLTFCGMRKKWGEKVLCQPSSFIGELDFEWIEETNYEEMMNAEASPDELEDFFGGMRAMLD